MKHLPTVGVYVEAPTWDPGPPRSALNRPQKVDCRLGASALPPGGTNRVLSPSPARTFSKSVESDPRKRACRRCLPSPPPLPPHSHFMKGSRLGLTLGLAPGTRTKRVTRECQAGASVRQGPPGRVSTRLQVSLPPSPPRSLSLSLSPSLSYPFIFPPTHPPPTHPPTQSSLRLSICFQAREGLQSQCIKSSFRILR